MREIELSEAVGALMWGLRKGAGHKYIRRVPKAGGGYRYYYRVSGVTRDVGADLQAGAKFRLTHDGQAGHFEVVSRDGDRVRLRHDESGGTMTVSASELGALLHREHADVVAAKRAAVARDLAQARKTGSAKQIARLEAEAKRHGATDGADLEGALASKDAKQIEAALRKFAEGGDWDVGTVSVGKNESVHISSVTANKRLAVHVSTAYAKPRVGFSAGGGKPIDAATFMRELKAADVPAKRGAEAEASRQEWLRQAAAERAAKQEQAAAPAAQPGAGATDDEVAPRSGDRETAKKSRAAARRRKGRRMVTLVAHTPHLGAVAVENFHRGREQFEPVVVATVGATDRAVRDAVEKASRLGVESVLVVSGDGTSRRVPAAPLPAKREQAHRRAMSEAASLAAKAPKSAPAWSRGRTPLSPDKANKRAMTFASSDESRPNLGGAFHTSSNFKIEGAPKAPAAVATDGHRLAIIPSEPNPEWDGTTRSADGGQMDTMFPDYRQVIPDVSKRGTKQDTVSVKQMSDALKALRRYVKDGGAGSTAHGAAYFARDGVGYLRSDLGDARIGEHVVIPVGPTTHRDGHITAFNVKYMQDALAGANGAARISTRDDLSPIHVEREDGEIHVIMPMRL